MKRAEFLPYQALYLAVKSMADRIPDGVVERLGNLEYVEMAAQDLRDILEACSAVSPVEVEPKKRAKREEINNAD